MRFLFWGIVMKRLVLCFDGTWNAGNDPKTVTNVVKFAQAIKPTADNGTKQIVYYNSGVGSGGKLDRILGGLFGFGLQGNVKRGLAFLSLNYEAGDEIYLFGFSRGAYTARALSGVIGGAGIPQQLDFEMLGNFWKHYRIKPKLRPKKIDGLKREPYHPRVKCVGAWDTVGAYGIPAGLGLSALTRLFVSWTRGFHDREFGKHIDIGLHTQWLRTRCGGPLHQRSGQPRKVIRRPSTPRSSKCGSRAHIPTLAEVIRNVGFPTLLSPG